MSCYFNPYLYILHISVSILLNACGDERTNCWSCMLVQCAPSFKTYWQPNTQYFIMCKYRESFFPKYNKNVIDLKFHTNIILCFETISFIIWTFCLHIWTCTTCRQCLGGQRGLESLELKLTDSCQWLCQGW